MAYVLLPNVGNTLGGTRDQIRTNFTLLKTTIDKNHIDMDGSFPGKHIMSQYNTASFPGVGTTLSPTLDSGDATVYGKAVGGTSQVFFSPDNTAQEYQITNSNSATYATFGTIDVSVHRKGWTFLPGGLILNYGSYNNAGGSNGVFIFARPFTVGVFSISGGPLYVSGTLPGPFYFASSATSNTQTQWNTQNAFTGGFYIMAIGK